MQRFCKQISEVECEIMITHLQEYKKVNVLTWFSWYSIAPEADDNVAIGDTHEDDGQEIKGHHFEEFVSHGVVEWEHGRAACCQQNR